MINGLISSLPAFIVAVALMVIFVILASAAKKGLRRMVRRSGRSQSLGLVVGSLLQWVIFAAGMLIALSVVAPSFQARDLINLLGISGLAIGFAFKDIFQNFLAGILLLLTEPFRIGDQIVIGAYEGTVEDIQTRATSIRTYDGRRVVIPNSVLFTEAVAVGTAFGERQSEQEIHLPGNEPVEQQKEEALQIVRDVPGVAPSPAPTVVVTSIAPNETVLVVRWWTAPQSDEMRQVRDRVLSALRSKTLTPAAL